jgi:hypothetical protein
MENLPSVVGGLPPVAVATFLPSASAIVTIVTDSPQHIIT